MERAPQIGTKVSFPGNSIVGACIGTVTSVHKKNRYPADFDWDSDDDPHPIGVEPERNWRVSIKVDQRPKLWPYENSDVFASEVSNLTEL